MTDEEAYEGLSSAEQKALDLMCRGQFPEDPTETEKALLESLVEKGYVDAIQTEEALKGGWFELTVDDPEVEDLELCRHVIPSGDLRNHNANDEGECWCEPFNDADYMTWWHNAADGREEYETGRRKHH